MSWIISPMRKSFSMTSMRNAGILFIVTANSGRAAGPRPPEIEVIKHDVVASLRRMDATDLEHRDGTRIRRLGPIWRRKPIACSRINGKEVFAKTGAQALRGRFQGRALVS